MLTRKGFAARFGTRPLFGMVHLKPLPGAPLYGGSIDAVLEAAVRDARALHEGGCDGLAIENFGDRPFYAAHVPAETIAAMTRIINEVAREVPRPFGVNVLRNDAHAALAIAAATGAAFIRINVHTGVMVTDQGLIEGQAAETMRLRERIAPLVFVFADYLVKHAQPLGNPSAKDLRSRGLADAIIITGEGTGVAADPQRLAKLRDEVDAPILIGSGIDESNAALFAAADGAIVGTSLKRGGDVDAPVDRGRVERVVRAFKQRDGR